MTSDNCPQNFGHVPNLGSELIGSGLTFAGYSESMPSAGYTGCGSYLSLGYIRTHNPWADFSNVPAASNLGGYATWAQSHNSLLIVTWDEDGTLLGLGGDGNKVPAIFYGAHVRLEVITAHPG